MIQFNLLPDVKLEYIRARRSKHMMVLASFIASASAIAVLVLLFVVVEVIQKNHLKDLDRDVAQMSKELKDTPSLNRILTVQNQLRNLPALHNSKPVATRLFGYIGQVTPAKVTIAKVETNFTDNTINLTGAADSINTINTFVDTLKFTTYKTKDAETQTRAFSSVVLSSFGRDDKGASYSISFKYDPAIFSSESDVIMTVPKQITTRSETEKPTDLFQPNSNLRGQ